MTTALRAHRAAGAGSYFESERAVKHLLTTVTHGQDNLMKQLMDLLKDGLVSKEELTIALRLPARALVLVRAHQAPL